MKTSAQTSKPLTKPAPKSLDVFDLAGLAAPGALCAGVITEARRAAGLDREELAARIGVPTQIYELWEDATWEGHSLEILSRVARAVGSRLELRIAPPRGTRAAAQSSAAA